MISSKSVQVWASTLSIDAGDERLAVVGGEQHADLGAVGIEQGRHQRGQA